MKEGVKKGSRVTPNKIPVLLPTERKGRRAHEGAPLQDWKRSAVGDTVPTTAAGNEMSSKDFRALRVGNHRFVWHGVKARAIEKIRGARSANARSLRRVGRGEIHGTIPTPSSPAR